MVRWPKVTIVVLHYDSVSLLGGLVNKHIQSLLDTDYPDFEVLMVDNGSHDATANFLESICASNKRFVLTRLDENVGFSRANNIGASLADKATSYLVFLNNDTVVTKSWLRELVRALEGLPDVAAAQSKLLTMNGRLEGLGDFVDRYGYPMTIGSGVIGTQVPLSGFVNIFSARGACFIIRKHLFHSAGGFDELFPLAVQDVDLGWRLRLMGHQIICVLDSVVYHVGGATVGHSKKLGIPYRDYILLILKDLNLGSLSRQLWLALGSSAIASIMLLVRQPQRLRALLGLAQRFIGAMRVALGRRTSVPSGRHPRALDEVMIPCNLLALEIVNRIRWHLSGLESHSYEEFWLQQVAIVHAFRSSVLNTIQNVRHVK